jgi:hypothetical protein
MNIRYFTWDEENMEEDGDGLVECTESEFLSYDGEILYERHTMRENGANQICLTKYPKGLLS